MMGFLFGRSIGWQVYVYQPRTIACVSDHGALAMAEGVAAMYVANHQSWCAT